MLNLILRILFRNPDMNKDISGKNWVFFMKYIRQMVEDLHQSLKRSEESGLQIDESASCRLYIWLISNLFQERLFKLLKRDPNDLNEKLHKTLNEIVKSFDKYEVEERDTEDKDPSEEEWSEDDEFELGDPPPKSLRGRTWAEANEWGQIWSNQGKYLIQGKEKTNDDAIFREIRYSPYSQILYAWICESWVFGHNIIEYLAITLQYTDKFFSEEDVLKAIELSESHLNMKNKTLLDDWEKIKLELKNNR